MKPVMKGWKKVRDDVFDKVYERRVGNVLLKVWAHGDPEDGVGPWYPDYRWTLDVDDGEVSVTSKTAYESPEEAVKFAEDELRKMGVAKAGWTKEWPTKPGRYWFYGWPYGNTHTVLDKAPVAPELNPVCVWENGSVVRDGNFWYKKDGAIGLFCEAVLPGLPDVSGMAPKVEGKKGKK